ncbi:MAG: esterase [Rubripirellula sp.]|nr:esterase [Rubripirellula sp.]
MNLFSVIHLSAVFLVSMNIPTISNAQKPTNPNSTFAGVKIVDYFGYDDCIELQNSNTRVILCPAAGGRVLEYSVDGRNVLYLPPGSEGWRQTAENKRGNMHAGRFDIGPEKMVKRGRVLWQGTWQGELTGDRSARMTSEFDKESGVRLTRDFRLDTESSRLICTQTIANESNEPVSLCYWSRTFAVGGGIAVVPRSPRGRFPKGFVLYQEGESITIDANDPNIQVTDEAVVVTGPPASPKLGFDSHAGWLAYLAPTDQLFVKRYRTFPERAYNEFASLTASVWYPDGDMVEVEPIGPAANLRPGEKANFTEEWWLMQHRFPTDLNNFDFSAIKRKVDRNSRPPANGNRDVVSPVVNSDQSVTFRITGKDASEVRVRVANRTRRMELNQDGAWEHQTEPLTPGIHEYTFNVDGVRVTDPRNRVIKKWLNCASMVEVPANPGQITPLTQQQSVPHGTLHHHIYSSTTTGQPRNAVIYTPPGYDLKAANGYPLVILLHGNGDDQTAWTEVGRAHHIIDNLIHQKKISPMLVAMPYGHPIPLKEKSGVKDYGVRNNQSMTADVVQDLLPLLTQNYNVTTNPAERAIVGLSMGGGQAIHAGLSHPELFEWVGAFSAAAPQGNLQQQHPELAQGIATDANDNRKLLWIGCGVNDSLLERNRKFVAELTRLAVPHNFEETQGGHSWPVWRAYLPKFLEQLF